MSSATSARTYSGPSAGLRSDDHQVPSVRPAGAGPQVRAGGVSYAIRRQRQPTVRVRVEARPHLRRERPVHPADGRVVPRDQARSVREAVGRRLAAEHGRGAAAGLRDRRGRQSVHHPERAGTAEAAQLHQDRGHEHQHGRPRPRAGPHRGPRGRPENSLLARRHREYGPAAEQRPHPRQDPVPDDPPCAGGDVPQATGRGVVRHAGVPRLIRMGHRRGAVASGVVPPPVFLLPDVR